ncbi:hypothetical protein OHS33_39560 (plasmid) [Streptomyces sp. NBC_00536]|uniref:hypothetical protein n=1 Tax=Streptomyces sp. NBC_00536 TaxID=2975769 RepID=UPI002E80DFB9|nr:hypothetical protein [Streptomyces sp. NBC_00536]WUC84465.1 hypothetical protein OHS33_39560 [Streptomyces sp. NBC_00536]
MPLSIPLLLVPGHPDHHYTVHIHRVRLDSAAPGPLTVDQLAELESSARRGLRSVSECAAAELVEVEVIEDLVGADAVARMLCNSDICAAAAEGYLLAVGEDAEAEAARTWAAGKLQAQTVEVLKRHREVEKAALGKTSYLFNVVAAMPENETVVMLDEAAHLIRENNLFPDRSPEGVRKEIDRLIRQGREPYPVQSRVTAVDLDPAGSLPTWTGGSRGSAPVTLTAEGRAQLDQLAKEWNQTPPDSRTETEN